MNQVLPYVPALVCPLSMGIMIWVMMRGSSWKNSPRQDTADTRVIQLEREMQALREARPERVSPSREAS